MKKKALLLAAGLGTRLKPLTDSVPKCLVQINGMPILERWIRALEECDFVEILINTHHHNSMVSEFICSTNRTTKAKLIESYEKELLGTAGTLLENVEFFDGSIGILIHADNATDIKLKNIIREHEKKPDSCLITMLTFKTDKPSECGIVECDKDGIVKSFHEKESNPPGNIANGAVYVFGEEFITWLKHNCKSARDFSFDVLPKLIGKIYTYQTQEPYIDIGTPEKLKQAHKIWKPRGRTV